jgi:hypothetical protein
MALELLSHSGSLRIITVTYEYQNSLTSYAHESKVLLAFAYLFEDLKRATIIEVPRDGYITSSTRLVMA